MEAVVSRQTILTALDALIASSTGVVKSAAGDVKEVYLNSDIRPLLVRLRSVAENTGLSAELRAAAIYLIAALTIPTDSLDP